MTRTRGYGLYRDGGSVEIAGATVPAILNRAEAKGIHSVRIHAKSGGVERYIRWNAGWERLTPLDAAPQCDARLFGDHCATCESKVSA